jgi:curved DNA-binding protein CbpA
MAGKPDDSYSLLGVGPSATTAEVRRAYRRRIVVSHRSRVLRLVEHLEELKLAYETLRDPARRREHDLTRREERARSFAVALPATAPDSSDGRRREGKIRAEMARELDAQSRQRSAEALAATSESVRALAREHDEREAAGARWRARRELLSSVLKWVVWAALLAGAVLAARLLADLR